MTQFTNAKVKGYTHTEAKRRKNMSGDFPGNRALACLVIALEDKYCK